MSTTPDLDMWIHGIKSREPLIFEAAFHGPRPTGPEVVPRLLAEMQRATDTYTRGKLIELLGGIGATDAVPKLVGELSHSDQDVRQWAVTALRTIGGDVAIRAVEQYEREHHEEFV